METRANYVAVGVFVLACIVGLAVTILWLAGAQYNQEYSYYQTYFKGAVTGLGKGTVIRYNGIAVGRVTDLNFDPTDPQSVIVTLQVQPNLRIREDSVASIDSQGLTGATFIEISGGTGASPVLTAKEGQQHPVIATRQSTLAQLEQSAPEVVAKLNITASRVNDLLSDDNQRALAHVLVSLDETTAAIARRSADIDATIRNASEATADLRDVTKSLKPTFDNIHLMVADAGEAMANLRDASRNLKPMLDHVDLTVGKFDRVADDAHAYVTGDSLTQLSSLIVDMRRLVINLNKFSEQLNRDPTKLLFGDRRPGYQPK